MIVLAVAAVVAWVLWLAFGDVVLWSLLGAGVVVCAAGAVFAVRWMRRTVPYIRAPAWQEAAKRVAGEHPVKTLAEAGWGEAPTRVIEGVFDVTEKRLPPGRRKDASP